MSTREQLTKARLGVLALAQEREATSLDWNAPESVSASFTRSTPPMKNYGAEGLAPQLRRKPWMPNQTPPEIEDRNPQDDRVVPDL
ncbi:MAG TPA: hypothetical protein VFQ91_28000 [Bryobacteraceae bacterium]|nr:hypothetical protein [Bryobacteraceae bacterium]